MGIHTNCWLCNRPYQYRDYVIDYIRKTRSKYKPQMLTTGPPYTTQMKFGFNVLTRQYMYSIHTEVHDLISGLDITSFQIFNNE